MEPFSSDTGTLRTDGRTDRRTDKHICYINIARQYADAIKTVESAEYTCLSQQSNSTNSAAIVRMAKYNMDARLYAERASIIISAWITQQET